MKKEVMAIKSVYSKASIAFFLLYVAKNLLLL